MTVPGARATFTNPGARAPINVPGGPAPISVLVARAPITIPVDRAPITVPGARTPISVLVALAPFAVPGDWAPITVPGDRAPITVPGDRASLWLSQEPSPDFIAHMGLTTTVSFFIAGNIHYVSLGGFFLFFVLYSALLHLPPLRFHCADECWDRTPLQLVHWQSDALTTKLDLIFCPKKVVMRFSV
jgi:hypothetical protein